MPLGEDLLRTAIRTPRNYARKVWCLALIYILLATVSAGIVFLVLWRARHLVTLSQRSNVETMVLLIILFLALYHGATTFEGLIGGVRLLAYNVLWYRDKQRLEQHKQSALAPGDEPIWVCLDKLVLSESAPGVPIRWELGDSAGVLGVLEIDKAVVIFRPQKRGINGSLFEYVVDQLREVAGQRAQPDSLQIVLWGNIDDATAAAYRSMVEALDRLGTHLGSSSLWPSIRFTDEQLARIGEKLSAVVPTLRDEAFLPDLEFKVEYSVPILPEPLAFIQLRRQEERADPVLTMGYALLVMTAVLAVLIYVIVFPPWVPSK